MIMLLMLNLLMTIIFFTLKHPLSLGLTLLIQTLLISMITGNFCYNFWFSYILFLIMIGGMLVLFIYMTSIASNEKFKMNFKIILFPPFILLLIYNLNNFVMNLKMINNKMLIFNKNLFINMSMTKYLIYPSYMILMFIIIYLFITLIAVIKISNINKGPLRQNN